MSPSFDEYNMMSGEVVNNSFLNNLKAEGVISDLVFSFYLSDD